MAEICSREIELDVAEGEREGRSGLDRSSFAKPFSPDDDDVDGDGKCTQPFPLFPSVRPSIRPLSFSRRRAFTRGFSEASISSVDNHHRHKGIFWSLGQKFRFW